MKRIVVIVVLLLVAVAIVAPAQEKGEPAAPPASESERPAMPWDAPVPFIEEGAQLITIGFWADAVGLGLIAGAGPAYSLDVGVANGLFGLGFVSMLFVANPCLQVGMNRHHEALEAQGYDVSEVNRNKSQLFSRISLGCGAGSLALGIISAITDSFGVAIASNLVGVGGAVFEIINFYVYRRNWGIDMKVAAGLAVPQES
jgi:hypothetical protein